MSCTVTVTVALHRLAEMFVLVQSRSPTCLFCGGEAVMVAVVVAGAEVTYPSLTVSVTV